MAYSLRSIVKGSLLYTFGQVLTKGSAFLLIPLYTRFMTPEEYGIFGYMHFALQIMTVILMLGFNGAQTRFYYDNLDKPKVIGEYLFSVNFFLCFFLLFSIAAILLYGKYLYNFIGSSQIPYNPYVKIASVTAFFQVMNQMSITFWITQKKYLKTTIYQSCLFVLITVCTIFCVVILKTGAEGQLKGILYGNMIFFLLTYYSYAKKFVFKISYRHILFSLSFGIPIVFHLLASAVNTSIDKAILAKMVPISELGIYTLGYQFGMVLNIIAISINQAWMPSYYDIMQKKEINMEKSITQTYNLWIIVMSIICAALILFGGNILLYITPNNYHAAADILPYIFLGYFFHSMYFFASAPIFFYNKTFLMPIITGSAAIVNIFFNYLMIPKYGIIGAALATNLSMLFLSFLSYIIGKKIHKHKFNFKGTFLICTFMSLLMLTSVSIAKPLSQYFLCIAFFLIITLILIYQFDMLKISKKYLKFNFIKQTL